MLPTKKWLDVSASRSFASLLTGVRRCTFKTVLQGRKLSEEFPQTICEVRVSSRTLYCCFIQAVLTSHDGVALIEGCILFYTFMYKKGGCEVIPRSSAQKKLFLCADKVRSIVRPNNCWGSAWGDEAFYSHYPMRPLPARLLCRWLLWSNK